MRPSRSLRYIYSRSSRGLGCPVCLCCLFFSKLLQLLYCSFVLVCCCCFCLVCFKILHVQATKTQVKTTNNKNISRKTHKNNNRIQLIQPMTRTRINISQAPAGLDVLYCLFVFIEVCLFVVCFFLTFLCLPSLFNMLHENNAKHYKLIMIFMTPSLSQCQSKCRTQRQS